MKIESVENHEKIKSLKNAEKFWDFIFNFFMIFNRFYLREFFSYISNQVIKEHLLSQKNRSTHSIRTSRVSKRKSPKCDLKVVIPSTRCRRKKMSFSTPHDEFYICEHDIWGEGLEMDTYKSLKCSWPYHTYVVNTRWPKWSRMSKFTIFSILTSKIA